jgi:hypothetical protein
MGSAHDQVRRLIERATLAATIEGARPDAVALARALWALPQAEAEQFADFLLDRAALWRGGIATPGALRFVPLADDA